MAWIMLGVFFVLAAFVCMALCKMAAKMQPSPTEHDATDENVPYAGGDWCEVCNAPQMVMSDGTHQCE